MVLNGDCTRQDMTAAFMKRLAKHFSNEMAVVTPNGQMLHHSAEEGLKKWRALPVDERTKLDDLGVYDLKKNPAPPPGGLVLKVFARGLEKAEQDQWKIYRNPKAHLSQEPGRDHLWFTEEEWRSLIPAEPTEGETAIMPAPLADRICRRYLIDLVRIGGEGGPRSSKDTLSQELHLTVMQATPAKLKLQIVGLPRFVTRGEEFGVKDKAGRIDAFHVEGALEYDRRAKKITRFDMTALSEAAHYDQIARRLVGLGVTFELTPATTPADRVRPHSYYADYFDSK